MSKHDQSVMAFFVFKEAWYANDDPPRITVSMEADGGGTTGEFTFKWHALGRDRLTPRLEVFQDAWDALREVNSRTEGRFLGELAAMDGLNPQPDDIKAWLLTLGFEDRTPRERSPS